MTRKQAVKTVSTLIEVRGKGEWTVNGVDVRAALKELIPELKENNKKNHFNEEDILV